MRTQVTWSLALMALVMSGSLVAGCKSHKGGKSDGGGIEDDGGNDQNPDGGPPAGTPGFSLSKSSGLRTDEKGATDTFTLALTSQPKADVTIALTSSDTSEGLVTPTTLVFTSVNWNAAQTVTVTGQQDDEQDGDKPYSVQFGGAQSSDAAYANKKPADVTAINVDDDTASVSILGAAGLTTSEPNTTTSYRLKLNAAPSADVVIALVSSDTSEVTVGPATLTFTSANWNAEQTVTLTGVDDLDLDGPVTVKISAAAASTDAAYNAIKIDDVTVINKDNETAGFFVVPTAGLRIYEDGRAGDKFTVALNSKPTANVTVPVSSSDTGEATVSTASLVFTPDNWNAPQRVNVRGVDDLETDGDQPFTIVLAAATSSDARFQGADPTDVTGINVDDESAGFSIADEKLIALEGGPAASFSVSLNSKPADVVTVAVSSLTPAQATSSPVKLTFTPDDWASKHVVTVAAVDDIVADGPQQVTIDLAAALSGDLRYAGKKPDSVIITVNDNDSAGLNVVAADDLTTTEAGATATFTVALFAKPTASVTVPVVSGKPSEIGLSPATLTFTVDNWQSAQTVTLKGVDDLIKDGNQPVTITLGPSTSTDAGYTGKTATVVATNLDDDIPGALIAPKSGLQTDEGGGQADFTISLIKKPTATVQFEVTVSKPLEASVSTALLIFTPDNYDALQTVTLRGLDDDSIADGDQPYEVTFGAGQSSDTDYQGLLLDRVSATNLDNDSPGIVPSVVQTSPSTPLLTTEAGATANFTVKLKSRPLGPVTLTLTSSRPDEGIVTPVTVIVPASQWAAGTNVTITGVNDDVADGAQDYQVLITSTSDADPKYAGLTAAVDVRNTDDDTAGIVTDNDPTIRLRTREDGLVPATFSVSLNSKPTSNVVIPLTSSKPTEGVVSPSSLTFTPASWRSAQTVSVTGVGDLKQDGNQPYEIVLGPVTGDAAYAALPALPPVRMLSLDTDSAGIEVTYGNLVTTEANGTATFTVSLLNRPSAQVEVPFVSSNLIEGATTPSSVIFDSNNYASPQTVTITGVDDLVADGNIDYQIVFFAAVSNDPTYAGRIPPAIPVQNEDNDSPGLHFSLPAPEPLLTNETGTSVTFDVSLNSKPVGDITIGVTTNRPDEVFVPPSITFLAGSWTPSTVQHITIIPLNDAIQDGDQPFTVTLGPITVASSADNNYRDLPAYPAISGLNADNDTAAVLISQPTVATSENLTTDTFSVSLNSEPAAATVTVLLTSSNTAEATVTPSVTFTKTDYFLPHVVTVTGVNDDVADGPQPYAITVKTDPAGADAVYTALAAQTVTGINSDNDAPEVVLASSDYIPAITPPVLNPFTETTTETRTIAVTLQSRPTASVSIPVAVDDTSEIAVDTNLLTFTVDNWNVPQNVVVSSVNDDVDDGDQTVNVVFSAAISDDPKYNGVFAKSRPITNIDKDSAGFTVPTTAVTTYEANTTDTFTIRLNSQPLDNVVIAVVSTATNEATVSAPTLTFTAGNWNVDQTVTVSSVNDLVKDGVRPYTITLTTQHNGDPLYDARTINAGVAIQGTSREVATSCATVFAQVQPQATTPALTSGAYVLDVDGKDGPLTPFNAYCDVTTVSDGITGGWTLLSWTANSETEGGVPYPGVNYVDPTGFVTVGASSSVPAAAVNALLDVSSEFAQGQVITDAALALFGQFDELSKYEFAGSFKYGTLSDVSLGGAYAGCAGLKTGTYVTIKDTDPASSTVNNGVTVFLNQSLVYAEDATLSNFTPGGSYVWSVGNRTSYCALNGTAPASFVGTWQDGQYGPRYLNSAGAYSVWVR